MWLYEKNHPRYFGGDSFIVCICWSCLLVFKLGDQFLCQFHHFGDAFFR